MVKGGESPEGVRPLERKRQAETQPQGRPVVHLHPHQHQKETLVLYLPLKRAIEQVQAYTILQLCSGAAEFAGRL